MGIHPDLNVSKYISHSPKLSLLKVIFSHRLLFSHSEYDQRKPGLEVGGGPNLEQPHATQLPKQGMHCTVHSVDCGHGESK